MTECDAAIAGLGTVGLAAAYHIKQPRPDERVPVTGNIGSTTEYAPAEKPKSR